MKQRILSTLLALAMLLTLVPTVAVAAVGGKGTETEPYIVSSAEDWKAVCAIPKYGNLTAHIKLTSNIDLSATDFQSITLTGSLDGGGFTISGLTKPLLDGLNGSTVKNLAIVGANITGESGKNVGILAKSVIGNSESKIENCYVSGSVTGSPSGSAGGVGGLIGKVEINTTISNCAADVTVTNTQTSGSFGAGGLVGYVSRSNYLTISHCYATGTATTDAKHAGGLVGAAPYGVTETIQNSVALQSEISNGDRISCEGRIAGGSGYFEITNFTNNYAYSGMTGKYHTTGYTEGGINGTNVSKEDCTKTSFWTKLGFNGDTWTLEDGKLPRLTNLSAMTGTPPTYLLDAASCPVEMGEGQKVSVSFKTIDEDTETATDTITIVPKDNTELNVEDFQLSSSKDALVSIQGLNVTALNGNTLTVSMSKSVTATTAYLFYNSYCLGAITLEKIVSKVALPQPASATWDDNMPGRATWTEVTNATNYSVQLYKDGTAQGNPVTTQGTTYDFAADIADTGSYTFGVKALGDNTIYNASDEKTSNAYQFTQQTLADVKDAAEKKLQEMQVSNDTTAKDVLDVVNGRITNKKITAAWSDNAGFKLTLASDGKDPGTEGKITGTIVLKLADTTETKTITVNLTIQPKFSVTFAKGEGNILGDSPTQPTVTAGTTITLPDNPFTYYGKKFNGWSDGTNTYQPNDTYIMPSGNVTFTAQWKNDVWDGTTATTKLNGSGTEVDPYIIANGADLNNLANRGTNYCYGYYKLMADIDMGGHEFSPIYHLVGIFDGNDHKITNLKIKGDGVYYGLFKEAGSNDKDGMAVIKNLTLDGAILDYTHTSDGGKLGLLVSYNDSNGLTIENCFVTGTINAGTERAMLVGGLVGQGKNNNVKISRCYAGVTFTGSGDNSYYGGLIGKSENGSTIENSYTTPNMDKVTGGYSSGIANGQVTIKNCYAAGEKFNGAGIASSTATVSNSVSIFPEMTGSARIGVDGTNNYGFAGTIQRDSSGIVTPPAEQFAADKAQGADATAAQLKDMTFYQNTLGWDQEIWQIRSDSDYAFPVLKGQKTVPTLKLDLEPSVVKVELDKTSATLPCGGTLQLKATVDVKNGADRTVIWHSSDPTKAVVDGNGKVTVQPDATSGEVKITATAAADGTKMATATLRTDANSYTLTATKDPKNKNSRNATYAFYEDKECKTKISGPVQAGKTVYICITNMDKEDIVGGVTVNGTKAKKLDNSIYYFEMPCENASAEFYCAEWINAYNYAWFVGSDWGTWGETVTYTTKEWNGTDHIGSLTINDVINGKLFDSFEVKSMTACDNAQKKESGVTLTEKFQYEDLRTAGDYFVDKTTNSAHPVLYVYNDKPGTVIVNINVKNDPNATYNITQETASKDYYTLSTYSAKAGDTVTATLTQAGIAAIGDKQSMTLDYYGGLLVVMFPGQFHDDGNGNWTASFTMPPQDITTRVYVSGKHEVTLTGEDKEVAYNGQPQTINSAITAKLGDQDVSEAMWGHYVVTYNDSTTPPTDVGTYTCKVKIPDSDPLYFGEMEGTVKLTITKSKPDAPAAPTEKSKTSNSVTLNPPTVSAGYTLEYRCGENGEWQDSPEFTGLLPGTSYEFYARIKETSNTNASNPSQATQIITETITAAEWKEDQTQYKLVLSASSDPQMKASVTKANSRITENNIDVYAVKLLSKTGNSDWQEVTSYTLPEGGITAALPYPAGSGATGYDFVVMQGPVESATALSVSQKTAEGLQVKLTSLSPIAVGYCQSKSSGNHGNNNNNNGQKLPFVDVKESDYFYDAVEWAVRQGVTNGTSATTFSPDLACTRAQIVTFLWRTAGSPEPTTAENPFTDVRADAYYYKAVLWAVERGITNGTSATTFSPEAPCTRAHSVTFLWRADGKPDAPRQTVFADVADTAYYAPAVAWATEQAITNGTSATTFSPDQTCTRAQIVTFLYRASLKN